MGSQQDSVVRKNLKERKNLCQLCTQFTICSKAIISMSGIKDTTDPAFDKQHIDLSELDLELDVVESRTYGQDMSEELLGIVADDTLRISGMAYHDGR